MPAKRLLRLLILLQIPVGLAMGLASYLTSSSLPFALQSISANKDLIVPGATVLAIGFALAYLASNICLFVVWRGAPVFYLVTTIVVQLLSLLLGPFVTTGWTDLCETCLTLLNGLTLGLIYFSPAREIFQHQASPPVVVDQTPRFAMETPVEAAAVVQAPSFCAACGAPGQGGKFCPKCGKPLLAMTAGAPGRAQSSGTVWLVIAGVVVALVLSIVAVRTVMKNQQRKAAEKAREDKSNYDFEHRDFDPTKLLKDQPGRAQTDAEKGRDVFDRLFYERNCDAGDVEACGKAAVMNAEGRGTAPDPVKAMQLHRKACEAGRAASCEAVKKVDELVDRARTMSLFGVNGKSVKDSQSYATAMFVQACDAGSAEGCAAAAARYRDAKGVVRDYARALELYRKACAGGERKACEDMKEIPAAK